MQNGYTPMVIYSEEGTPLASIDAVTDELWVEMRPLEGAIRASEAARRNDDLEEAAA